MVYELEEILVEANLEQAAADGKQAVLLVTSKECPEALNSIGIYWEGEIALQKIRFCKIEAQQEYIYGTLSVPKLLDISGSRYRVCLFITRDYIVIVDDSELSSRIFSKIRQRRIHQGENKARFLFNYLAEIIDRDYEMLDTMEQRLMEMEEEHV